MAPSTLASITTFIQARYPLLSVQTHEEQRLCDALRLACAEQGRPFVILSVTSDAVGDGPLALLEAIAQAPSEQVTAVLDFYPWLSKPTVERALRNQLSALEAEEKTVVFVSAEAPPMRALASDVVHFDLPLPDSEMLSRTLHTLVSRLDAQPAEALMERAVRAVSGLTEQAAKRALSRLCQHPQPWTDDVLDTLIEEKRRILRQTDLLEFVDTPPGLSTVGGLDVLKGWLSDREQAHGKEAQAFGLPTPKGLRWVGVQGCGKSLTAKAIADHWTLPLVRLEFGALFGEVGSAELNLRRVTRLAEALSPIVLWIDEIDKALAPADDQHGISEHARRVLASMITWLQEKTSPVFVVATANEVQRLPPELLRKGRFDEVFFVDLPNLAERKQILKIHLQTRGRDPSTLDLDTLARVSEQFSGAELEQAVIDGLFRAFKQRRTLQLEDVQKAIEATVPLSRTYEEPIKVLREWAKTRARHASSDERLSELWNKSRA